MRWRECKGTVRRALLVPRGTPQGRMATGCLTTATDAVGLPAMAVGTSARQFGAGADVTTQHLTAAASAAVPAAGAAALAIRHTGSGTGHSTETETAPWSRR